MALSGELEAALACARERFGTWPDIRGFGFGRKFLQRQRCFRKSRGVGPLCLHVFVGRKLAEPPPGYRLPKRLYYRVPGRTARKSIELDVVALGKVEQQDGTRRLTSAGPLCVGRLFGFEPPPAGGASGQYEIGTAGALVSDEEENVYAVSSGHVFINTGAPSWNRPSSNLLFHLVGRTWALPPESLQPPSLGVPPTLVDGMAMRLPAAAAPDPSLSGWPRLFRGEFASDADVALALSRPADGAFVWAEREGASTQIPVDLVGHGHFCEIPDLCPGVRNIYPYFWTYHFPQDTGGNPWTVTLGGDSGSGLYVPDANDPRVPKLLGFHFAIHRGDGNAWIGTAIPAENFIAATLGEARLHWT